MSVAAMASGSKIFKPSDRPEIIGPCSTLKKGFSCPEIYRRIQNKGVGYSLFTPI